MCGISGLIDFKKESNESILKKMANTLTYRGPDAQGIFIENSEYYTLGLAHNRLSIIDLSTESNQPMTWSNYTIVFNGEIYNFHEIKDELINLGHQFITHGDTEVILHAFDQWQYNAVDKFRGMFAFVIYDKTKNNVTIYRDRAGVKPLYYYWDGELFLFASELKAFHQHPRFHKELDQDALALFIQYSCVPAPYAIYKNTKKLEPGHYMNLDLSTKNVAISQYWNVDDAYKKSKIEISDQEAINSTLQVLTEAFEYRMVADVPVGVFLSGGFDSSAVTAILQKNSPKKIKTFTIGFHEAKYNEAPYAKEIAQYLGTEHTEYYCTIDEAKEILPTLPYYYDEPFGDSSAIPTILVSKLAREQVTVSLSADGGDEIFGGYNRHGIIPNLHQKLNKFPSPIKEGMYQIADKLPLYRLPYIRDQKLIEQRYHKFKNLLKQNNAHDYLNAMSQVVDNQTINKLLLSRVHKLKTNFDKSVYDSFTLLDGLLCMDYQTYLPDDILTKVDRATMSVALEGREPFLDHNIIEWVAQLPDNLKIRNGEKKWLLKQIVYKYIPKELMDRPKAGFAIPIDAWFENELNNYFSQYFNENLIKNQGIFNFELIDNWIKKYQSGQKEYISQLWNLLMFQMWYEQWMN